ncbi:MAG: SDR family oxidoreductase [Corynebacterium sp.]|nr:SDR family oxidoreductase [Corynebacterium sp.]
MAQQRSEVVVLIGTGPIGQAIARRVSAGRILILADVNLDGADLSARQLLQTGFTAVPTAVDITSRDSVQALCDFAVGQGDITHVIHAAGVSLAQATASDILTVELYGTALVLEIFGEVIAEGGAGIVVSSHSGHQLPALYAAEDRQLAITPTEKLLNLPMLRYITDPIHAMQISKRANTLRVQASAMSWGIRGARINAISPGIVMTPMAREEFAGPSGDLYRDMIEKSPARRAGTPDEIGQLGAFLLSKDAGFITGSDFLIDGGVTSAWFYGGLQRKHA